MNQNGYVIGVDLGGTNVRAASVSAQGEILSHDKTGSAVLEGYQAVLNKTVSLIESVANSMDGKPEAIGIASPGAIDFERGIVTRSPNFPDWTEKPFGKDIAARLDMPVTLDNDGAAAAIGEGWIGAASDWKNFMVLTLGTGIGGGIVLDKKIWRGENGMAGEIGHINVVPDGRPCGCGSRGCVETYSSAAGVKITAQHRFEEKGAGWLRGSTGGDVKKIDAEVITDGALTGDTLCKEILNEAGEYLGKAIAQVSLILDISKFVIGGGMAPAFEFIEPAMRKAASKHSYTLASEKLLILPAKLGDNAGIIGSAKMALDMIGN